MVFLTLCFFSLSLSTLLVPLCSNNVQHDDDRASLLKALKLRARALLLGGSSTGIKQAAKDIREAVLLAPSDRGARALVAAVKQRQAAAKKKNRKLSREVAKWVRDATDV